MAERGDLDARGRHGAPVRGPCPEAGFTLIEAVISILILTVIVLSFGQAASIGVIVDLSSRDLDQSATLSVDKIEELRSRAYADIAAGGSLEADVSDYFDAIDLDGDGETDYSRRWEIVEEEHRKVIRVRVISATRHVGSPKQTALELVVAKP